MLSLINNINIDFEKEELTVNDGLETQVIPISDPTAFEVMSKAWLRCGWDAKYVYGFSWLGRPIIQLPEDIVRIQEVIYMLKPDFVIETGVAHGGGLILYASILNAIGKGEVIGVDIDIRAHNRKAIEEHELAGKITLIEGDSIDISVIEKIGEITKNASSVLVVLDSNHSKEHVLNELHLYSQFVTKGSYIIATDGIMADLVGAPRSESDWAENNPQRAVEIFLEKNPNFEVSVPHWPFNEGSVKFEVTYWPNAWLRRK